MPSSKKKFIMQSRIQSSNTMACYMSTSSSSSSSSLPPTSSPIDLTSSLPPTTTSASTSQRDGGKTSYIWTHGKKITHDDKDRWACNHCKHSYTICGSATTNQRDHLNIDHGILDPKTPVDTNQSTLDNYRRPLIHLDVLRKLIIEWIVKHHHSFNETESKALHRIFKYLDPRSTNTLMSRNTLKADVDKYFKIAKAIIKEHLSLT